MTIRPWICSAGYRIEGILRSEHYISDVFQKTYTLGKRHSPRWGCQKSPSPLAQGGRLASTPGWIPQPPSGLEKAGLQRVADTAGPIVKS